MKNAVRLFGLVSLVVSGGCSLTPQARDALHPEWRQPTPAETTTPKTPLEQYLADYKKAFNQRFGRQVEREIERERAHAYIDGLGSSPADLYAVTSVFRKPLEARLTLLRDGSAEGVSVKTLSPSSDRLVPFVERAYAATRVPMPPEVVAATGGRIRCRHVIGLGVPITAEPAER